MGHCNFHSLHLPTSHNLNWAPSLLTTRKIKFFIHSTSPPGNILCSEILRQILKKKSISQATLSAVRRLWIKGHFFSCSLNRKQLTSDNSWVLRGRNTRQEALKAHTPRSKGINNFKYTSAVWSEYDLGRSYQVVFWLCQYLTYF